MKADQETFELVYEANGADSGDAPVDDAEYGEGDTVVIAGPGSLGRDGHVFAGWNRKEDGSGTSHEPEESIVMPGSNLTLYAQWEAVISEPESYTVTYDPNGSDEAVVPVDDHSYSDGDTVTVSSAEEMTRPGYTFTGWVSNELSADTVYMGGDSFTIPSANVTLRARWELLGAPRVTIDLISPTEYTVDFEEFSGSIVKPGGSVTITVANGEATDGYVWYLDAKPVDGVTGNAVTLLADDLETGAHGLTVVVTRQDKRYSGALYFNVEN